MFIPTKENYTEMTPADFEQYALSALKKQFQDKGIDNYSFVHDVQKNAYDGRYQIDGEIEFSIMGVNINILVECKQYTGPVKREHIQVLNDKIRSTGANKGIFITTSYYQSGALKYAKEHGIALITIIDGKLRYQTRSEDWMNNSGTPSWVEVKPFNMVMITQLTDTSISVKYIDDTDALYQFAVHNEDGGTI